MIVLDSEEYARGAAAQIAGQARSAIDARGSFSIVLAGGSTPRAAYEALAAFDAGDVRWDSWEVFFGDERCVPPDDAESNYRMAREALLSRVPIPEERVHRMRGELLPEDGAREYDDLLRDRAGRVAADAPIFDLVLLGLGDDGHTASLFPGSPVLEEREWLAVAAAAPDYMTTRDRVTLTYPALARARRILFLVSGAAKREIVVKVVRGDARYPASSVAAWEQTGWLLDRDAAEDVARAGGLLDDADPQSTRPPL